MSKIMCVENFSISKSKTFIFAFRRGDVCSKSLVKRKCRMNARTAVMWQEEAARKYGPEIWTGLELPEVFLNQMC